MEWTAVTTETVRNHMGVEMVAAYDKWIAAYPEKAGRLEEIVNSVRTEFRDAIAAKSKNWLHPDKTYLPESAVRHCENIVQYTLGMEMGVQLTVDGRTLLTRADMYLRQIVYGHNRFADENDSDETVPSYSVPSSTGRALGNLVALLVCVFLFAVGSARAAWIAEKNETTYVPVNYDITEQSLNGHLTGIDNALGWLSDTNSLYGRLVALPAQVSYMQSLLNEWEDTYARKEQNFPVNPNWHEGDEGEEPGEENAYTLSTKGIRANDLRVDGFYYDNFDWDEQHGWTYTTNKAGIMLHGQRITAWSNLLAYLSLDGLDYIQKVRGDELGTVVVGREPGSPQMFDFDRPMGSLEVVYGFTLAGTTWRSLPNTNSFATTNALAQAVQDASDEIHEEIDELEGWTSGVAWLTPARFTWAAERELEPTDEYGPVIDWNYSILYRDHIMSQLESWHLIPEIQRNIYNDELRVDWRGDLDPPQEMPDGSYKFSWIEPGLPGDTASITGVLRDWFAETTVERGEVTTVTQKAFYAFAEGGLREAFDNVYGFWKMASGNQGRFLNYSRAKTATVETLELTPNPDFWPSTVFPPSGADLSGVSVWNDLGGFFYTKPVTLIASNVAMSAAHWAPPVGTTVAFYGKDDELAFSRVVAQTKCGHDMAFSKLSPPLDTAKVTAYPILDARTFEGHTKLPMATLGEKIRNVPMIPLLACAQSCTAWLMGNDDFNVFGTTAAIGVRPILEEGEICPHGRQGAVGGDSGHPVFVTHDGVHMVLVGCYSTVMGASFPGYVRDVVEPAIQNLVGTNAVRFETYPTWPDYSGIPN